MSAKTSSSVPRLPQPESEGHYSALQYVMWLVAGSEISILKKCPTDYNRHATIGYTLLITCVFAAIAGGYAGYFFSNNLDDKETPKTIGAALVIALVWGLLVYSIDRSMVVSLKKDPDSTGFRKYAPQLIVRAALGFLIAFFISIPIELLIFDESIAVQTEIDKANEEIDYLKKVKVANQIAGRTNQKAVQDTLLMQTQEAARNLPDTREYARAVEEKKQRLIEKSKIESVLNKAKRQRDDAFSRVPMIAVGLRNDGTTIYDRNKRSSQWSRYAQLSQEVKRVQNEVNRKSEEYAEIISKISRLESEWTQQKLKDSDSLKIVVSKAVEDLNKATKNVADKDSTLKATIENQNGFVRRFVALGNAADKDGDLRMLLWLVRAIFILVEILPTVVKIFTPPGQYDSAIYQAEKDFREIILRKKTDQLQTDAELEKEEFARQQAFKVEIEGKVHDDIVKKLGKVQTEIADRILDEYASQEINEAPKNISEFRSSSR